MYHDGHVNRQIAARFACNYTGARNNPAGINDPIPHPIVGALRRVFAAFGGRRERQTELFHLLALVGRLFLGDRDRKADSESRDLSVSEMERWLGEVELGMRVRNGGFDSVSPMEVLA